MTPAFLTVILLAYVFMPAGGWDGFFQTIASGKPLPAWEWSGDGMIGKLLHKDLVLPADSGPEQTRYFSQVRAIRTYARLALVGLFLFFSVLVTVAWSRRGRETVSERGLES